VGIEQPVEVAAARQFLWLPSVSMTLKCSSSSWRFPCRIWAAFAAWCLAEMIMIENCEARVRPVEARRSRPTSQDMYMCASFGREAVANAKACIAEGLLSMQLPLGRRARPRSDHATS
jgi:hypothetical protein